MEQYFERGLDIHTLITILQLRNGKHAAGQRVGNA